MTRFDFLRSARPKAFERVRAIAIPERLMTPVWLALTVILVTLAVRGTLGYRLYQAYQDDDVARRRFQSVAAALAQTKLERTRVEALVGLDRRLHAIHLSGSLLSLRLADIANHIPQHAWLTSIANTPTGIAVEGQAEGVDGLGDTVIALMSSRTVGAPELISASDTGRVAFPGVLAFELRLKERGP